MMITQPDGANLAHLLRSSQNAARLLTALERAKTRTLKPQSINEM